MVKPKKTIAWKPESVRNHVDRMLAIRDVFLKDLEEGKKLHVSFSANNRKLDVVPSVSTIPVVDCPNCALCGKMCYDVRHDCVHKTTAISRSLNSAILKYDMDEYFEQIHLWLKLRTPRFFRYNIGGDIKDASYVSHVVEIAKDVPNTRFLLFTKVYDVVNEWIDKNGDLPENLQIIFSVWPGLDCDNRHKLPSSHLLNENGETTARPFAHYCPGTCSECCIKNEGCFFLKKDEEVIFPTH